MMICGFLILVKKKQRAEVRWIREGNKNSFFHHIARRRSNRSVPHCLLFILLTKALHKSLSFASASDLVQDVSIVSQFLKNPMLIQYANDTYLYQS